VTKEQFLTVRWNNLLSLGLAAIVVTYVSVVVATSDWSGRNALIWLAIIGSPLCIVVELHTSMRFAWLRKNSANYVPVKQSITHPFALIRLAYNVVFWVFLLPFFTPINYGTGFIAFGIVLLGRLMLHLYSNNILKLTPERYDSFPFRI
jgi:hypothetical protein